jgi:hypothetical protein
MANVAGGNKTYVSLQVKCPIFLPVFNQRGFSLQIFLKAPVLDFTENFPVRAALIGGGQSVRRQEMTKLIGAFLGCANAPKSL